jgi:hypothetical protein
MESELWPNLLLASALKGVSIVALIYLCCTLSGLGERR